MSFVLSRHLISGFRARVPVPVQGASTRTRSKRAGEWHVTSICGEDMNIWRAEPAASSALHDEDEVPVRVTGGFGILFGNDTRLSSRRRTAIENAFALSKQKRNQLRAFILVSRRPHGKLGAVMSPLETSWRSKQWAGFKWIPSSELLDEWGIGRNRRPRCLLIVCAEVCAHRRQNLSPTLHQPCGMAARGFGR